MADSDFLKSVTLFVEFDTAELDDLRRSLHTSRFSPGDVILEEGNANRALHVIRSGRVRVSRRVQDSEVSLCDLAAGQTFGELSIIEDVVRSYFEVNKALVENPTFREAYAMCNR